MEHSRIAESIRPYLPFIQGVLVALALLIAGWIVSKWGNRLTRRGFQARKLDQALGGFLAALLQYTVLAAAGERRDDSLLPTVQHRPQDHGRRPHRRRRRHRALRDDAPLRRQRDDDRPQQRDHRPPAVAFVRIGPRALELTIHAWTNTADYLAMLHDLRRAAYEDLSAAGVEMPVSQVVIAPAA